MYSQPTIIYENGKVVAACILMKSLNERLHRPPISVLRAGIGKEHGNARIVSEMHANAQTAAGYHIVDIHFTGWRAGLVHISHHLGCGKWVRSYTWDTMALHVQA